MFKRIRNALARLLQVEQPAADKATPPVPPQHLEAKPEGQKPKRRKPNSGNRGRRERGNPNDNPRAHQFADRVRQGLDQ
jgi:hypothetical protein